MKRKEAAAYGASAPLLKSVARLPKTAHSMRGMHDKSVRTFTHLGHTISISTMYEVKVDGRLVHIPLMVSEDGHVQSHAIPNYSETSAVDIVKTIVEQFPDDFKKRPRRRRQGGQHGGHSQRHHR